MESRYEGQFSPNIMDGYCWTLKNKRKSKIQKYFKKSFELFCQIQNVVQKCFVNILNVKK